MNGNNGEKMKPITVTGIQWRKKGKPFKTDNKIEKTGLKETELNTMQRNTDGKNKEGKNHQTCNTTE